MAVEIFFDCGAPSLYNKLSKKKKNKVIGTHIKQRRRDDFSYVKSVEYRKYREEYVAFIKRHKAVLSAYPNLDVINSAELTYKNQKWLEKKGLHPCPVWHFGSDVKWLRQYIQEGYDYLCIGGMVPNHTRVLRPALDRLWIDELCNKDGMPHVKIHGFAMTSFILMNRYPWYSVDSKSWIDYSRFGRILVPTIQKGEEDWLKPDKVPVTSRSKNKTTMGQGHHFSAKPKYEQSRILAFLDRIGVVFGESKLKNVKKGYKPKRGKELWFVPDEVVEVIKTPGVCNTNVARMDVNINVFKKMEEITPEWPWSVHMTVSPAKVKGLFV